jgi:predicted secreted protein
MQKIKTFKKDEKFQIELDANQSTGYSWYFKKNSNFEIIEQKYIEPKTNLLGAGGKQIFILKANKTGVFDLIFEYKRVNEKTGDIKTITIKIE